MTSAPIEVRSDATSGDILLQSYASIFDQPYTIRGGAVSFEEKVAQGAFTRTLAAKPDTVFRFNHEGPPLARTTNGTLRLWQDSTGLGYEARLNPQDPDAVAIAAKVRRGDLSESSFAFRCDRDEWSSDRTRRTMIECDIHRGDVAVCTFGASSSTGRYMSLRAEQAAAVSATGWGGPGMRLNVTERAQASQKYTPEQLRALAKAGKAFVHADGSIAYPINDREDLANAIRAVGAPNGKTPAEKLRVFIKARATALGLGSTVPASWHADGSVGRSGDLALPPSLCDHFESQLAVYTSQMADERLDAIEAELRATPAPLEVLMEREEMEAQEVRELRQWLAAYKAAAASAYEDGARAGVKAGYDAGYRAGAQQGATQALQQTVPQIADAIRWATQPTKGRP